MSESLMVLTPDNVWSQNIPSYKTRSHLHWILQLTGTIMNIIGVIIMIRDKKDDSISLHAILGLLSVASMIFLCLSGTTLFYTVKLKKIIRPVIFKFIHTYVGIFAFVFAISAQCLGYDKKWVKVAAGKQIALLAFILTCSSALICILRPTQSLRKYFKALLRSFKFQKLTKRNKNL